jgi:hypothetical protein
LYALNVKMELSSTRFLNGAGTRCVYNLGLGYTIDSDLASVALFQVETSNARDAVAQLEAGKATLLETSKEIDDARELIKGGQ